MEIWTDKNNNGIEGEELSAQEVGDLLEGDVLMAYRAANISIVVIEVQQTGDIMGVPFMPEPVLDGESPEVVVGDIFEDKIRVGAGWG